MKFRIQILRDPDAVDRGYSLKGIKVPLRSFSPISHEGLISLDGRKVERGVYTTFWKIACNDLATARPSLAKHLKHLDYLAIPCAWCDVAPIERWQESWGG